MCFIISNFIYCKYIFFNLVFKATKRSSNACSTAGGDVAQMLVNLPDQKKENKKHSR